MKEKKRKERLVYVYFLFNTLFLTGSSYVVWQKSEWMKWYGGVLFYLLTIAMVLSPLGEWMIRCRVKGEKMEKTQYAKRMSELLQEVIGRFEWKHKKLGREVKLFLCKDDKANAFAVGRKTICLTEGMMKLSDRKIKATIAHELGHIYYHDTLFLAVVQLGNHLICITLMIGGYVRGWNLTKFICFVIFWYMWTKCGIMLINRVSREHERRADQFAADLGYAEELCEMLRYVLAEIKKTQ